MSTFEYSPNLTPIGYSARTVPTSGTGSGAINSDLAFQGKYAYQRTYTGFRILDIENPADPKQLVRGRGPRMAGAVLARPPVGFQEPLSTRLHEGAGTARGGC